MQLTQTHTVCILIEKTRPSLQEISSKTRSFTSIRYYKFKHSILYRKCLYRPHPSQEQSLQTMSFTGTISSNRILYRNHFFKPCPFQDLIFFTPIPLRDLSSQKNCLRTTSFPHTERLFHPV